MKDWLIEISMINVRHHKDFKNKAHWNSERGFPKPKLSIKKQENST